MECGGAAIWVRFKLTRIVNLPYAPRSLLGSVKSCVMKVLGWTAALSLLLVEWAGSASADPWKDESGKGRWRGGYERSYDGPVRGYGYGHERPRRERRAFKEEYYDGRCKVERNGDYKEERKCRAGVRSPRGASYGYQPYPSYGYRY
jgi:hypothetical protein